MSAGVEDSFGDGILRAAGREIERLTARVRELESENTSLHQAEAVRPRIDQLEMEVREFEEEQGRLNALVLELFAERDALQERVDECLCQAHAAWNPECAGCLEEERDQLTVQCRALLDALKTVRSMVQGIASGLRHGCGVGHEIVRLERIGELIDKAIAASGD